jgi:hypothetical protein
MNIQEMGHVRERLHEWIRKDDTENATRNEPAHRMGDASDVGDEEKDPEDRINCTGSNGGVNNHPSDFTLSQAFFFLQKKRQQQRSLVHPSL